MDISALSLALGAPIESTEQTPVAPGFEFALEQAEIGGFIPPGAPPGPEPPPDILVAGEGVEVLEPNAQPQKLDLLPQEKVNLDIQLPQPFWEKPMDEELPVCPPATDEAMEWLAGQMMGGFFTTPMQTATDLPAKPVDAVDGIKPTIQPVCEFKIAVPQPSVQTPVGKTSTPATPDIESDQPEAIAPIANSPINPNLARANQTDEMIAPEIVEALNISKIEVEKPVAPIVEDATPNILNAKVAAATDPVVKATSTPTPEASDLLFTKQPLSPSTDVEATPKADAKTETTAKTPVEVATATKSVAPQAEAQKPIEKMVDESTKLDVTSTAPKAEQAAKGETPKEFGGQSGQKDDTFTKAVIESEVKPVADANATQPEVKVEANTNVRSAQLTEGKSEALAPKEVDLVLKQVVDKLHMLAAARPKNGVTIHLNPEDLGSITVVVKSIGRMVDTQLSASDQRVRQALDQNQTRLVEAMDARGFQVQNVTVSAQTNSSTQQESTRNWQQPSQQQDQNHSQSGHSHGHRGQPERQFEQPKSNIRAWVRRGEGVDLSI